MTKPKRQHWVPCFYLRHFATPETRKRKQPQVWILSKHEGDPALTSVLNVANQRYLYSPRDANGGRQFEVESRFARYESVMKPIWPSLADDFVDLQAEQALRRGLALFVSLLYLRHPRRLAEVEKLHTQIAHACDALPKDQFGNPVVEYLECRGVLRKFDNSEWKQFKAAGREEKKSMFVHNVKQNATYIAELLLKKRWSVVFSDMPLFITTDCPVAVLNPTRDTFGLGTPGTVVSFPLSPTRILVLDDRHDQPEGQYYPLAESKPGPENLVAWTQCESFMISPRHPDEICAEMLAWSESERL